jgi:hypothetical protein
LNSSGEKLLFGLIQRTYLGFDAPRVTINSFNWSANYLHIVSPAMPFAPFTLAL